MGPLPSASSRDAQPERQPEGCSATSAGDPVELGQLTQCLCAVRRDARKQGTISEIFSPPRVAAQAQLVGMRPGFSVDLETQSADGQHWDLCKDSHVEDLFKLLEEEKPTFLGGSPPCGPFSSLQNLVDAANKKHRFMFASKSCKKARSTCARQCEPIGSNWKPDDTFSTSTPKELAVGKSPCVQELRNDPRVYEVVGPMCRWEMESTDARGASGQCSLWGLLQYFGEDVAQTRESHQWTREIRTGPSPQAGKGDPASVQEPADGRQ